MFLIFKSHNTVSFNRITIHIFLEINKIKFSIKNGGGNVCNVTSCSRHRKAKWKSANIVGQTFVERIQREHNELLFARGLLKLYQKYDIPYHPGYLQKGYGTRGSDVKVEVYCFSRVTKSGFLHIAINLEKMLLALPLSFPLAAALCSLCHKA